MLISGQAFLDALQTHNLLEEEQVGRLAAELHTLFSDARPLADELCSRGLLTVFQADHILRGHAAELVLGPYVLQDKLGEGGMGTVYKALHRKLKAIRAVKIIRPDALTSRLAIERFYRESQAVASLKHPNIIIAHDINEDRERHYFVMEYAPGCDLSRLLRERGRLPLGEACDYVRQAALGLQHAHERGLVHRDIKPSNLLLATDERLVKILDLGLARLRETTLDSADPITPNGMLMGTPDYMAPEQAEDSSGVDTRADIYSLGCTLYQLLTGSVPFPGGSLADKLRRHYCEEPPPLTQLRGDAPAALAAIVARMMAKTPQQRYQVPAEVAEALRPFCTLAGDDPSAPLTRAPDGSAHSSTPLFPQTLDLPAAAATGTERIYGNDDVATRQVTPDRTSVLAPPRRGGRWLLAGLLLLAAGGGAAVLLWPKTQQSPPQQSAEVEKKQPPHVSEADPTKKPPVIVPPPPPEKKPPALPEPRGSAKGSPPGEGAKGIARAGNVGDHVAKGRGWRRAETLRVMPAAVRRVAFSGDGSHAAVLVRSAVELYDLRGTAKPESLSPFHLLGSRVDYSPVVAEVALSHDGSRVYFGVLCRSSKLLRRGATLGTVYDALAEWDGRRLRLFFGDEAANDRKKLVSLTRCLVCSADGKTLLAGTSVQLKLWDLSRASGENASAAATLGLQGLGECLACSPSGKRAVAGLRDGSLRLYRLQGEESDLLGEMKGDAAGVRCVAFASDAHLVSGDAEGTVLVWRVPEQIKEGEPAAPRQRLEKWHDKAVLCVASSARGDYFASGGIDGFVCLGKVGDSKPVWREPTGGSAVRALVFSADGRHVLFATDKGIGRLPVQPLSEATVKE